MDKLAAVLPSLAMAVFFVVLLVTALRATDWASRERKPSSSSEGRDGRQGEDEQFPPAQG